MTFNERSFIHQRVPRSPQQNREIREATRARIMNHALALFSEHGYDATSVKMIAQAAGVSQGLLYNYFTGKDALLRAIFEASVQDVLASFEAAEAEPDVRKRPEVLIRASFAIVRGNLEFWRLSYGARMQRSVLSVLGGSIEAWASSIHARLLGFLTDAGIENAPVEAAVLFALIDGISQHYVLDPEHYPLDVITEHVVGRYAAPESER